MFQKIYHTGEIHDTLRCGKFEIIEDNGIFNENNQRIVKIRYLDTGYEDYVLYKNAIHNYCGQDKLRFMYEVKDKIFTSNNYGDYRIIEDLGSNGLHLMVKVKFLDTGYEYITRRKAALEGKVKDRSRFMYDNKDITYDSKYYGPVKIISEAEYDPKDIHHKHRKVNIQFLLSGSITTVRYEDLLRGEVSDPKYNNPQEAAEIIGIQPIMNVRNTLFSTWKSIMDRCTNPNSKAYDFYGAKGVTVSDGWMNFEVFLYDTQRLPGWEYKFRNPLAFHIDKDLLQMDLPHSERKYSRNTCVWLDIKTNTEIAHGAEIDIIYDNIYTINGLYFVKSSPGYFSYGPYFSLEDALQAPVY